MSNFAGAAAICSVNNQPAFGGSAPARLQSFRLWPAESRFGCRHSQGKGCSSAGSSNRQLAHSRGGEALGQRIWCINSEGAEKQGYDRCFDRLWPEKGRGCRIEAGRCSTPRRTLGDCGFEWKRRSHTDRSGAGLGKEGNRRVDNVCRTHFGPTVPSHQQGRTDVGKWIHVKGDLVNRQRRSRELQPDRACSTRSAQNMCSPLPSGRR